MMAHLCAACSSGCGQGVRPAGVCLPAAAEESGHCHCSGGGEATRALVNQGRCPARGNLGRSSTETWQPPLPNPAVHFSSASQAGYNFLFGLWKYQWDADCELFLRILLVGSLRRGVCTCPCLLALLPLCLTANKPGEVTDCDCTHVARLLH